MQEVRLVFQKEQDTFQELEILQDCVRRHR
jgi:hypothetical protein